jgi:RNA polymerase sigma-70 factor (ECF subfamily)
MTPSEAMQRAAAEFIRDRRPLEAFIYGLIRDAAAAEDLLQEVWVRLATEVEKGTRLENQAAWCRSVARHLALRHWEKQRTAKVVGDSALLESFLARAEEAFAEADATPEAWAARHEALDQCVAALPERSRRLLNLKYTDRAPLEAIATALGQSLAAVKKALFRLRGALLECVERKLRQVPS